MLFAVHFNDQFLFVNGEVGDIVANRYLSPYMQAIEPAKFTQLDPKAPLASGHGTAQFSRTFDHDLTIGCRHQLPPPLTPPRKGEGIGSLRCLILQFAGRFGRTFIQQEASGLPLPQLCIEAAFGDQGIVRTFLDDPALVHHHQPVHRRNR